MTGRPDFKHHQKYIPTKNQHDSKLENDKKQTMFVKDLVTLENIEDDSAFDVEEKFGDGKILGKQGQCELMMIVIVNL